MKITVSRAARILKQAERTTRAQAERGELPCIKTEAGWRLFDRDVIERIAAGRAAKDDDRR